MDKNSDMCSELPEMRDRRDCERSRDHACYSTYDSSLISEDHLAQMKVTEPMERPRAARSPCCSGLWALGSALYPSGFIKESRPMLAITLPIIVTQIWQMLLAPVSMWFCSQLGDAVQQDGAALSISLINLTCISIGQGLGTACDTFFSQAYGGTNKKRLGVYVQRALIIYALVLTVFVSLQVNAEALLLLCSHDPVVARLAGQYLLWFIPGAASFFMFIVLSKYLQSQSIVYPNVVIGLLANLLNALLHYCFLFRLHTGITGSAVAQACSHFFMLSMTLLYILCSSCYANTWSGWSLECLKGWGQFSSLCFPGLFMLATEWWGFEIGIFFADIVGITEQGAQSVLMQLKVFWFQIPLGIQIATAIRVGQYLGAGQTAKAKTVSRLSITIGAACSLVACAVFMRLQYQLSALFTNVPEVIELTVKLLPIFAVYLFFDGIAISCKGTLHGTGQQFMGMIIISLSYFVFALSAGISYIFLTELRTVAYWYAMALTLVLQSLALFVVVMSTDWYTVMQRAKVRSGLIGENGVAYTDCIHLDPHMRGVAEPVNQQPETFRRRHLVSAFLSSGENEASTRRSGKTTLHELWMQRMVVVTGVLCVLVTAVTLRLAAPLPAPTHSIPYIHHNATAATLQALVGADPMKGAIDIKLEFTQSKFIAGGGHLTFPGLPATTESKFTFSELCNFYDYSIWLEKYFSTPEFVVASFLDTEPESVQPAFSTERPMLLVDRLECIFGILTNFTGSLEICIDFRLNVFKTGKGTISPSEEASTDEHVTFHSIANFAFFVELMKQYLGEASMTVRSKSVDTEFSLFDISLSFDKSEFQNGIAHISFPDEEDPDLGTEVTFNDIGEYFEFSVWLKPYAHEPDAPLISKADSATLTAPRLLLIGTQMADWTGSVDMVLEFRSDKFSTGEGHVSDVDGTHKNGYGHFTFHSFEDFFDFSKWLKDNFV